MHYLSQLYRSILRSRNAKFGPSSKESMETRMLMGILLSRTRSYDEALKCFTTVFKWQQAHLRSNDVALLQTKEYISLMESNLDEDEVSVWI